MIQGVIGFIGAGQMAQALAAGWVQTKLVAANQIGAYDPHGPAIEQFTQRVGDCESYDSIEAVTKKADILVLAVKPQYIETVLKEANTALTSEKLVVSIAAGVTLATLEGALSQSVPVVRVMPNTPCLVSQGACCYSLGTKANAEQGKIVKSLLSAVGIASETTEAMLDAVTGLSGSGPAYVYTFIEALADGGVRAGLPRALAAELAAKTVLGAAQMVVSSDQHPAALRDAVASPGGTTIAGLAELEKHGLRSALIEAVMAATKRSAELGKN